MDRVSKGSMKRRGGKREGAGRKKIACVGQNNKRN